MKRSIISYLLLRLIAFNLLGIITFFFSYCLELKLKSTQKKIRIYMIFPLTKMLLNAFFSAQIVVIKRNFCFHEGHRCFGVTLWARFFINGNLC